MGMRPPRAHPPAPLVPPPPPSDVPVMNENWTGPYTRSEYFEQMWSDKNDSSLPWHPGLQVHQGKLFLWGKLCVPEELVMRVLFDFHNSSGHIGVQRMLKEIEHRFVIPPSIPLAVTVQGIRRGCKICQASEPPHWAREGALEPFPVPERLMHSVCLDVF